MTSSLITINVCLHRMETRAPFASKHSLMSSAACRRARINGAGIALIAVLSVAAAEPAWSGGSNTSNPLPAPATPTAVTPSLNQTSNVNSATCGGQLANAINTANATGLALNAAGTATMAISGLPPAVIAGDAQIAAGIASQIAALTYTTAQTQVPNGLPNCDATFTGTVAVTAGGVNVSGNSIFNNNVAFASNASVTGTLSASQITASQGISAFGGAITIGDPSLTTYSSGITLGGGALSGAGTGDGQAFTGNVTAIAIGNNAQATQLGSVALGESAQATGVESVALGENAQATQLGSVALGNNSQATGVGSMALGNGAQATQLGSVALGDNAFATGMSAVAVGNASQALAGSTVAIGYGAMISAGVGAGSFAGGTSMVLSGTGAVSIGNLNMASGNGAVAIGDPNVATGTGAVAIGANNAANGQGAVAIGNQNTATGVSAVAVGQGATASAPNAIAIGGGATATIANSAAFGAGATATFANSTAIGAGATASTNNQVVLGTGSNTITAPGIDSALSRGRQSGLLGVVTSDSAGNLASDGGALYEQVATIKAGAAVAMALSDPTLGGKDRFGVKLNYGTYDNANAIGMSAAGLVYSGLFNMKNNLVASAAVGYGTASVQGYTQNVVGGHAGLQLSW